MSITSRGVLGSGAWSPGDGWRSCVRRVDSRLTAVCRGRGLVSGRAAAQRARPPPPTRRGRADRGVRARRRTRGRRARDGPGPRRRGRVLRTGRSSCRCSAARRSSAAATRPDFRAAAGREPRGSVEVELSQKSRAARAASQGVVAGDRTAVCYDCGWAARTMGSASAGSGTTSTGASILPPISS